MRAFASSAAVALVMALMLPSTGWNQSAQTQADRDYVFTDEDGHLVLRFAGSTDAGLDSAQHYEILNQEFSRMVHDRLHADLQFAGERRDPEWAASMEPRIADHVRHAGPEFSDIYVECRAESCRLIMEQPLRWDVPEHQVVLGIMQQSIEAFIAAHREHFVPGFLITAYYQETSTSHIKAFLRRT